MSLHMAASFPWCPNRGRFARYPCWPRIAEMLGLRGFGAPRATERPFITAPSCHDASRRPRNIEGGAMRFSRAAALGFATIVLEVARKGPPAPVLVPARAGASLFLCQHASTSCDGTAAKFLMLRLAQSYTAKLILSMAHRNFRFTNERMLLSYLSRRFSTRNRRFSATY